MIPGLNKKGWDKETALKRCYNLPGIDVVKNKQVHLFGEDYVVILGPRFILTLEQVARVIHPDAP